MQSLHASKTKLLNLQSKQQKDVQIFGIFFFYINTVDILIWSMDKQQLFKILFVSGI